jgi:transcriptional regulator with XRE-family HTH domain
VTAGQTGPSTFSTENGSDLSLRRAFGKTIRRLRRDKDLSQAELAARAGLAQNHIGEIERSQRDVKLQTIVSLAAALGMYPWQLLARAEAHAREQALNAAESMTAP